jgi:hypothetical protein
MPPYGLNLSSKPFSLTVTSVRRIVQRIQEIAAGNISPKTIEEPQNGFRMARAGES